MNWYSKIEFFCVIALAVMAIIFMDQWQTEKEKRIAAEEQLQGMERCLSTAVATWRLDNGVILNHYLNVIEENSI